MAYYPRPAFKQEGIKFETKQMLFSSVPAVIPQPDYPVSPLENFKLAVQRKTPYWLPNSILDFDALMTGALTGPLGGPGPAWGSKERSRFTDDWGCEWLFVPEAGGPMLDPKGKTVLDDITEWEKVVKFPDVRAKDWKTKADDFHKHRYDPKKVLHINIGQGCTERFVALLGGYTEAMIAMAEEPEACAAFFDRFGDWMTDQFDVMYEYYPEVNLVTYHDDWGTERDTFFSEKMLESMVLEPTRRIIRHVRDKGVYFELHSCGNIKRFFPYMVDMNVDLVQLQRRANDLPGMKKQYGNKIGFCAWAEGIERDGLVPQDELLAAVRKTVDFYGKSGGAYSFTRADTEEKTWAATFELYCYSREFYDKEAGR
jgi:hypothetical protein